MLGKFAAVIGPALMGAISLISGNIRYGIISIVVLFICGGFMLYRVDQARGEQMAREHL